MQYTRIVLASTLYLLLFACSSDQVTESLAPVAGTPKDSVKSANLSGIPTDGKLRDEHLQMYVSVQIIQEQIRYQQTTSGTKIGDANVLEKQAINHFEFDNQLYHWVKKVIKETSQSDNEANFISVNSTLNPVNAVVAHNRATIKKYKGELEFVKKYKLQPRLVKSSPNEARGKTQKQVAFPLKTSS